VQGRGREPSSSTKGKGKRRGKRLGAAHLEEKNLTPIGPARLGRKEESSLLLDGEEKKKKKRGEKAPLPGLRRIRKGRFDRRVKGRSVRDLFQACRPGGRGGEGGGVGVGGGGGFACEGGLGEAKLDSCVEKDSRPPRGTWEEALPCFLLCGKREEKRKGILVARKFELGRGTGLHRGGLGNGRSSLTAPRLARTRKKKKERKGTETSTMPATVGKEKAPAPINSPSQRKREKGQILIPLTPAARRERVKGKKKKDATCLAQQEKGCTLRLRASVRL